MNCTIEADNSAESAQTIQQGLELFNRRAVGFEIEATPLNYVVRDAPGNICGGIIARTYTDTLYFDTVWISEALRGKGVGHEMMTKAEAEARKRGARHAWLATLSWQARPFYEKLGYRVFGQMPVMDGKHVRYFMQKDL